MNASDEAIFDKLNVAALTALVGTRLYRQAVPQGATYPLVVYHLQAGGDENRTPTDSLNLLYGVRAVSDVSPDEAGDIDDVIRPLLHKATLTVSGYTHFWLGREAEIRYTETDASGKRFHHAGAFYRVRLSA